MEKKISNYLEKDKSELEAEIEQLKQQIEKHKKWEENFRELLTSDYYLVTDKNSNKKEVMTLANIFDLLYNMLARNNNIEDFSDRYKAERLDKEKAEILYGTKKKES